MTKLYLKCLMFGFLVINIGTAQQDSLNSGYINVKNGKLYYESKGDADETIVFIHDGFIRISTEKCGTTSLKLFQKNFV